MEGRHGSFIILACLVGILLGTVRVLAQEAAPTAPQAPLGVGFTYQGQLKDSSGNPLTTTCDFRFSLWDAEGGGSQVGANSLVAGVSVLNGYFTAQVNSGGEFGANAFTGQARWLEVSVKCGGEPDYTLLDPRQPLTAAPYASYAPAAGSAPWSGLSGVPAGFADGLDNDTTYTAGDGLTLSDTHFDVAFAGDGTAATVARSDHNHLDETWEGSNNSLVITGTFGSGASAPLVLSNADSGGRGLRVIQGGDAGVSVGSANYGVVVEEAVSDGVYVVSAGDDGMYIGTAADDGIYIGSAGTDGLYVNSAGNVGAYVDSALTGFGVNSVSAYGLFVGSAGSDGLYVGSTGHHGMYIGSVTEDGIYVDSAGNDGMRIYSAGDDGLHISDAADEGIYVFSAGGDGLYVGTSTNNGVDVSGDNLAGYFAGNIEVTGNCVGCLMATFGVNAGDRSLEPGEVVTILGMRPGDIDGFPTLWEVLPAGSGQAVVGVVQGRAELVTVDEPRPQETGRRLVPREGAAGPGEYVTIVIYGPVQVRVNPGSGAISPGMRLAVEAGGLARPLATVTVEGVNLAESAPTIGIALSAPDEQGYVWVLVNPQ